VFRHLVMIVEGPLPPIGPPARGEGARLYIMGGARETCSLVSRRSLFLCPGDCVANVPPDPAASIIPRFTRPLYQVSSACVSRRSVFDRPAVKQDWWFMFLGLLEVTSAASRPRPPSRLWFQYPTFVL